MLPGDAGKSLPNRNLLTRFDGSDILFDTFGNQIDIFDAATVHTLHGGDFAIHDTDLAALSTGADHCGHRIGTQINCNYVISVFHFQRSILW